MAAVVRYPSRPSRWQRYGEWVLLLTIGLCLSRALLLTPIRDAFEVHPKDILLRQPGATASVVLDWLMYLPALLVCIRAVFDETFHLRWPKAIWALAALGVWAIASISWSADRFAAAVSAGKLLSGAAILWALVQLVRDWRAMRIVTASLAGLVAVLFIHCLIYRLVDVPDMQKMMEQQSQKIMEERGWDPSSFQARQFAQKVNAGELMGFCASPNSLAAMTVLLALVLAGDLIQRKRDGRPLVYWAGHLLVLLAAAWLIVGARSRTAAVTPILGLILIIVGWKLRGFLATHRKLAFFLAVAAVLVFWEVVVNYGLYHGSLLQRSLTFRWHYWTASIPLLADHLLKGVGWENFGDYYLQYRLPIAPEEIRDPHNLFMRFATELGLIGLGLALAWLGTLFWGLTRPAKQQEEGTQLLPITQEPLRAIAPLVWVAVITTTIVILSDTDFGQDPLYWFIQQVMRRVLYGAAFLAVAGWLAVADIQKPRLDESPMPWALLAGTVGLLMFLVHNFIDFAMFEPGPWYVTILIAGSVLAMRITLSQPADISPATARPGLLAALGIGSAWVGTGVLVALPVILGEDAAHRGDAAIVDAQFPAAAKAYTEAYGNSLWLHDYEYLARAAHAQVGGGAPPDQPIALLTKAVEVNPRAISPWLDIASLEQRAGMPQDQIIRNIQQAVNLNPTNVGLRLQLADALAAVGRRLSARQQYRTALYLDEQLPFDEPKRLPTEELGRIQGKLQSLEGS